MFIFRPKAFSPDCSFQLQSSIKVSGDFSGQFDVIYNKYVCEKDLSMGVVEIGMKRRLRFDAVNLSINFQSSFVIYLLRKWIHQSDNSPSLPSIRRSCLLLSDCISGKFGSWKLFSSFLFLPVIRR